MPLLKPLTERCSSSLVDVSGGFSEMLDATQRYYVVGGKGGAGRTSMAAALAVKFANQGEPTLIVSTNPTRSLGDSFEQVYEGLCCGHASSIEFLLSLLSVLLMLLIGRERQQSCTY